jgi:predicted transcriptional regulator
MSTVSAVPRLDLMTVEEHMHAGILACDPAAPLPTIAWILADERIHCAVVIGLERSEAGSRLTWGAVTDRDLMRALAAGETNVTVTDIASTPLVTVDRAEHLDQVVALMAEHDVNHILVVENGIPIGIISSLDVARAVGDRAPLR